MAEGAVRDFSPREGEDSLFVHSLAKGMAVLQVFGRGWDSLRLTDIAERTGLSMGAAQRLTHTLTELGYLRKDPATRRYRLAPRILDFAYQYLHASPLHEIAIPFVVAARDECGESVNVTELDGREVVAVIRMPSERRINPSSTIGRRLPTHCTAGGRAHLAWLTEQERAAVLDAGPLEAMTPRTLTDPALIRERLDQARRDGFALVEDEVFLGEIALSAPILDGAGRPLATLGISTSAAHWTAETARERLAPVALHTAHAIARALRGWKPF
ncbi:IclR family transcriptional regulator [Arenibaculum pallidiluteum]|uniref:IclR family transcriptional regulator n=1 Tax=Arenibaculum pallidiluteum TaxID=2812559 RepID=UPI001A9626F8|nr:IclR family transcriptional regulator C-terminal domain-containing protein [Arenibaculum pallidiluteum]